MTDEVIRRAKLIMEAHYADLPENMRRTWENEQPCTKKQWLKYAKATLKPPSATP